MIRTDKENYYLDIAETVSERGTCLRRNFGAIIVQNDEIVATGYNGAPQRTKELHRHRRLYSGSARHSAWGTL